MNRITQNNNHKKKFNWLKCIGFIILLCMIFVVCVYGGTKIGEKATKSDKELTNEEKIEKVNRNEIVDLIDTGENEENIEKVEENLQENTVNNVIKSENKVKSNTKTTPGITDKKQEAIELVKKEWGSDDSVNFVFDYVNEKGEYIIAVKEKATSTVKNYFKVNLTTQSAEIDY